MKNEYMLADELFDRLFPLNRSILGKGYIQSLNILKENLPFEDNTYKSGEKVLNWVVPKEWIIREGWIKDENGNKILDYDKNNLTVINYSTGINKKVTYDELKDIIYTIEELPNAIPYAISYYKKRVGFCMSYNQFKNLNKDEYYSVYIDSTHVDGELIIGDYLLENTEDNKKETEFLISSYLCHPSMANNELSGPIVQNLLYLRMKQWKKRNLNYRFIINPETIGSISYLSNHGDELLSKCIGGFVLTCLGGQEELSYKKARNKNCELNNLMVNYKKNNNNIRIREFDPTSGSDERQYCSPGYNLSVGQISRTVYGEYEEYHTSLDNKEFMGIDNILKSLNQIEEILKIVDINGYYLNKYPFGEIKLDQYNLYPDMNGPNTKSKSNNDIIDGKDELKMTMYILNYSDGKHTLLDIANISGYYILDLNKIVDKLLDKNVLEGPYFNLKKELI